MNGTTTRLIFSLLLLLAAVVAGGCATGQPGTGRWDQQRLPEDQRPPAWESVVPKSM